MSSSLFVSIASVEDEEIYNCIEQIYELSDKPDEIFVGICHSVPFKNKNRINYISSKINKKNVSQKFINFYREMGVGYGRKNAMSLYTGQNYILQIDAHTNFQKSWDSKIINYFEEIPEKLKNKKTILTAYLSGYRILDQNKREVQSDGHPMYPCYLSKIKNKIDGVDLRRNSEYESIPKWYTPKDKNFYKFIKNKYVLSRKMNANFTFSKSYLADDYDKIYLWNYLFLEEEFISSIQLHDLGYSMVYPNFSIPLSHLYLDWYNEFYNENSRKSVSPDKLRYEQARRQVRLYLEDQNNEEKIKKYCNYAGLTYPEFESIDTFYIPGGTNED